MSLNFQAAELRPFNGKPTWQAVAGTPVLNLSNRNAVTILRFLGFEEIAEDQGGILPAELFAIRCADALTILRQMPSLDAATESQEFVGELGCRMLDAGLDAGYLTRRIEELLTVAAHAGALGSISVV